MATLYSPNNANLLAAAGVPAFKCPPGTKMHILNLGTLQADEGWSVGPSEAAFKLTSTGFCVVGTPVLIVTRIPRTNVVI